MNVNTRYDEIKQDKSGVVYKYAKSIRIQTVHCAFIKYKPVIHVHVYHNDEATDYENMMAIKRTSNK